MSENIREIAISKAKFENHDQFEQSLLFIGGNQAGKSTIIQCLMEQGNLNEKLNKTISLDYKYLRYSTGSLQREVCHLWEIGGGKLIQELIQVVANTSKNISIICVIDLSDLKHLLSTLNYLQSVKSLLIQHYCKNGCIPSKFKKDECSETEPLIVPLVIISSKYDIFQNYEPSKRKITCQLLESISRDQNASVIFYSQSNSKLIKNTRQLLFHHAFGLPLPTSSSTINDQLDWNKPLEIMLDKNSKYPFKNSEKIQNYEASFISIFPQENEFEDTINVNEDDPLYNPDFKENKIDEICLKRDLQ